MSLPVSSTARENDGSEALYWITVIVFITILGAILRLIFLNGPFASDDLRYYVSAQVIADGQPITQLDHAASRLAFLTLIGVPGALAGSIVICGIVNIVASVATQIVATLFTYKIVSPRAAVIVAAILGFEGLSLIYSGTLLPDSLLALFMLGCVMLVYYGFSRYPERATSWYIAAGLVAGLAYSTKDTGILLLVPVGLWTLLWPGQLTLGRRILLMSLFAVGFVAVWFSECLFYLIRADNFWYRTQALSSVHNSHMVAQTTSLYDFIRGGYWNLSTFLHTPWLTALPVTCGVVCWAILLRRRDALSLFALSGAFIILFLLFGTSSFTRFVNLPYEDRYVIPVLPFVAIGIAAVVDTVWRHRRKPYTYVMVSVAALMMTIGIVSAATRSGRLFFTEGLRNATVAVAALPNDGRLIYTSKRMDLTLRYYQLLPQDVTNRLRHVSDTTAPVTTSVYYLVTQRNGKTIWPDSLDTVLPPSKRKLVATVGINQRFVDRWLSNMHAARDTARIFEYIP